MNRFDLINERVRQEHQVSWDTSEGSGERWWCSCGKKSALSPMARTQAQTQAAVARHLRAAYRRIAATTPERRPSDADVLAALNRHYLPDGIPTQSLSEWSEGSVRAMRAVLELDRTNREDGSRND
ncbi:hypothetical protein ECC01_21490 [Bacillus tequilensis]|nr:hypothetical protein [Bacillus tequilensis]